jgi:hypothetical protein
MAIHGFVVEEGTKPGDERDLQVCPTLLANLLFRYLDNFSTSAITEPNRRVISNKLVTIFARHLDNFIMTQNFSDVYQIRKTGSGQFLQPRQVNLSPGLAKIAPWWLARRDSFSAKEPGLIVGVTAPPTLTAYTRCRWLQ